jgi:hypothetical protein
LGNGKRKGLEEQLVAFRFRRSTCVAVGTFNMYIVQPPWLAKIGILPKGTSVTVASKLDEPGFRFSFPKFPFRWFVSPSRMEVETESWQLDCGEKVGKVLESLPWTPLIAIGNNTIYTAAIAELGNLPEDVRRESEMPQGYEFAQRSFHHCVKREDRSFNLQLSITPEEIELSVNVHTELRDRDSEVASRAAHRFLQDREAGEALIEHFFKARIEHGDTDAKPAEGSD